MTQSAKLLLGPARSSPCDSVSGSPPDRMLSAPTGVSPQVRISMSFAISSSDFSFCFVFLFVVVLTHPRLPFQVSTTSLCLWLSNKDPIDKVSELIRGQPTDPTGPGRSSDKGDYIRESQHHTSVIEISSDHLNWFPFRFLPTVSSFFLPFHFLENSIRND